MAEQTRRVGLLKAVGGTPGPGRLVVLTENLVLALLAAGAGLAAGWLAAPLFTSPGAGLIGTPDPPSLTLTSAGLVVAVAVAVALAATLVPAIRAARTSTVQALAEAPARAPRRRGWLVAISATAAGPAAARAAARRATQATPGRTERRQHRDHGRRDRRRCWPSTPPAGREALRGVVGADGSGRRPG